MEHLEMLVNEYCERHGLKPKYTKRNLDEMTYIVETFTFDLLEASYSKAGKVVFKLDGKRSSIYK